MNRRRILLAAAAAALAAAVASPAVAQYPEKPVRVIVPTQAGGGMDAVTRIFQRHFEETGGPRMVVVNMEGAGGTVGSRHVRDAAPDGYTMLLWWEGIVTSRAMGVVDYDHDAFEVIGSTGFTITGLGIARDGPYKTVQDLIEAGKAKPNQIKVATNIGLPVHFYPLMFQTLAGVDYRYVQTGGGARRMPSVVGGHTDFALFDTLEFVNWKEAGLTPVVLFGEQRSEVLPDVPTGREVGIDLVARASRIWLAPKGTPKEVVDYWRDAFSKAMETPALRAQFAELGLEPVFLGPDRLVPELELLKQRCQELAAKARELQQ